MQRLTDGVAETVRDLVERSPDRVALRWEGSVTTHAELYERACRLAHLLLDRAPAGRRHLGVLADNLPECVAAVWACALSGGVYVALDPGGDFAADIALTETGLLLVEPKYAPLIDDATLEAYVSSERFLAIDREAPAGLIEPRESLEAAMLLAPSDDPDIVPAPDDLAALVLPDGRPRRAARCTHAGLRARAHRIAGAAGGGPLHHDAPLRTASAIAACVAGVELVLYRRPVQTGALPVPSLSQRPSGTPLDGDGDEGFHRDDLSTRARTRTAPGAYLHLR